MRLLPTARNGRFLAIVLFLIVVIVVYLIGVHWWFVSPLMDVHDQASELRDQHQRFDEILSQRGAIEKSMNEVRGFEQNNQAFLTDADVNSAFSDLSQRLRQVVDQHSAEDNRCQITGTSPSASRDTEVYQRVTAAVVMTCDTETFAAILYDLENSNPYLFVDRMVIFRQQQAFAMPQPIKAAAKGAPPAPAPAPQQNFVLGIQFNLSGYLRQPGKTKS